MIYSLIPFILGAAIVLQGSLNKEMGQIYGLSSAVLLNAIIFLILSLFFFFYLYYYPQKFPTYWLPQLNWNKSDSLIKWYYVLPGICGFLLVFGLPLSIRNLGVSKSVLGVISSQILVGFIVDLFIYNHEPTLSKVLGAIFILLGAFLVF